MSYSENEIARLVIEAKRWIEDPQTQALIKDKLSDANKVIDWLRKARKIERDYRDSITKQTVNKWSKTIDILAD